MGVLYTEVAIRKDVRGILIKIYPIWVFDSEEST
jgi:hypothetical protein